jgi:hypothetical protein
MELHRQPDSGKNWQNDFPVLNSQRFNYFACASIALGFSCYGNLFLNLNRIAFASRLL